jgi:hypothetical protein
MAPLQYLVGYTAFVPFRCTPMRPRDSALMWSPQRPHCAPAPATCQPASSPPNRAPGSLPPAGTPLCAHTTTSPTATCPNRQLPTALTRSEIREDGSAAHVAVGVHRYALQPPNPARPLLLRDQPPLNWRAMLGDLLSREVPEPLVEFQLFETGAAGGGEGARLRA